MPTTEIASAAERAVLERVRTQLAGAGAQQPLVIGIRTPEPVGWSGPVEHMLDGVPVRIRTCPSLLAVLDGLAGVVTDAVTVLLTALPENELGDAVLARLHRGRLLEADRYTLLSDLLGTRGLDPRIQAEGWLVDALIGLAGGGELPHTAGSTVGRRRAVSLVAQARLGIDPEQIDLPELVAALDDPPVRSRWTTLADDEQTGLVAHLREVLGPGAAAIATLAATRADVLAELLVAQAITAAPADDVRAAAALGAFTQSRFASPRPARADLAVAGSAAVTCVLADAGVRAGQQVRRGDVLLDELDAACVAVHSPVLPRGFVERLAVAAVRLDAPSLAALGSHRESGPQHLRVTRVLAASRLTRWLGSKPVPGALTAAEALAEHARGLGWTDRCLAEVRAGDADPRVGAVLADVAARAGAVRAGFDVAFVRRLVVARDTPADTLAVETVLRAVVAPLATAGVLLIVVDGMSGAVAGDLAEAMTDRRGWSEVVRAPDGGREAVLAALPTETHYSRSSLFRATLATGDAPQERAAFATHAFWPPGGAVLVHKAGVGGRDGNDLGAELEDALSPVVGGPAVVGVVLNTVDESLGKGRQSMDPRWHPEDIPGLPQLLERAATAGRIVVLTSDHGHMLEHGSELRSRPGGGARWHPPSGPPDPDEVLVTGPRVLTDDGSAVLAATEDIRYGARAHGYHGGATLAEVAIPLIVLLPPGVERPRNWFDVAAPPDWWSETIPAAVSVSPPAARSAAPKKATPAQVELFDLPTVDVPSSRPKIGRGERLLASTAFQAAHSEMPANRVPDPAVFAAVVDALVAAGGRLPTAAIAGAAGAAGRNPRGLVSALKRVLNRDGFTVLDFVDGDRAVALDVALLDEQFPKRGS